jgi:hypothetical protein
MIPKARSDQLFRKSGDVAARTEEEEMSEELFGPDGTSQEDQCPAFVRFLDKAERREFNRYKAEQEAKVSDDEGLPVFSFVTPNIRYLDNINLNEKTENNTPIHKWS